MYILMTLISKLTVGIASDSQICIQMISIDSGQQSNIYYHKYFKSDRHKYLFLHNHSLCLQPLCRDYAHLHVVGKLSNCQTRRRFNFANTLTSYFASLSIERRSAQVGFAQYAGNASLFTDVSPKFSDGIIQTYIYVKFVKKI